MLGTKRAGLHFFCPDCGADLCAPRADYGGAIDCHHCGESVHVPRAPHPKESVADAPPLISPTAAAAAARGLRLLMVSLKLYAASVCLAVAVVIPWALAVGPAAALDRNTGNMTVPLAVTACIELVLACTGACFRWVGYGRCAQAATAVRAAAWVPVAQAGAVIVVVGAVVAVLPGVAGLFVDEVPTSVKVAGRIGQVVRILGGAVELVILFVWARILTEAEGRSAARWVIQYATAVVGATAAITTMLSLAAMFTVLSLRKDGLLPADPFPAGTPAAVPTEGWYVLSTALSVAVGFALLLSWQYYQILSVTRAALVSMAETPSSRTA